VTAGAAAVIASSRIEARELAEDAIDPERILIRPNGIELDGLLPLPQRGAFRNRVGIPEKHALVLFLGRIAGKKGLIHLVDAVAQVPNVLTAIVGPDDGDGTVAALARTIGRLGVEDRVFLIPKGIWGRRKAEALADADCFCLPSATENFGNSAAEAAAVGLPVILSDRCGVAEFLEPSACRVVRYGDVQALKDAVIGLSDPGPREAAARAARRLRELLNWDELAVRQLEIYRKVVG
jgi:glycosyltransferase involved in cell wall biosynthesis